MNKDDFQNNNLNNESKTQDKIEKMRLGLSNEEKCKEFAQKLVKYISDSK